MCSKNSSISIENWGVKKGIVCLWVDPTKMIIRPLASWDEFGNLLSMMAKTIISVSNLTKKYGDFEAVKGISFDVYEGEIFGLLGPNGAGKSSTLEIMETLREKTSGVVLVSGFDL